MITRVGESLKRRGMRYEVSIYKFVDSSFAEIQTPIDAADPIEAALSVMNRFGLRSASTVFVNYDYAIVAQFADVDLDAVPASSDDCSVSYDYSL